MLHICSYYFNSFLFVTVNRFIPIFLIKQPKHKSKIMSKEEDNSKHADDEDEPSEPVKDFSWMPAGHVPLADGEYDAIVMGTGLTECIISGLLSVQGKRVLHVDRNNYYGADTASLSLANLFEKFRQTEPGAHLGHPRNWNVDLVPKFIMACGKLVKILLHTKVTRYLEFKSIDGSYVFKDGRVQKVPGTNFFGRNIFLCLTFTFFSHSF